MFFKSLHALVLMLAATAGVAAQDADNKATADPTGTWKWEREFNGNTMAFTLRLKCDDNNLTGSYRTVFSNRGTDQLDPVEITNGKLDGDNISFTVTRRRNDNEFTVSYSGKLNGDEIAGNSQVDFGNGAREYPWNARRVVTIDDLAGKWGLKFKMQEREVESHVTLVKDGDSLKGTYHSAFFGDHAIKDAELKDNQLSFVVVFPTDNGDISITYRAKPHGSQIAGVILATVAGQENETPFEGRRVAASDDDEDDDDEDDE